MTTEIGFRSRCWSASGIAPPSAASLDPSRMAGINLLCPQALFSGILSLDSGCPPEKCYPRGLSPPLDERGRKPESAEKSGAMRGAEGAERAALALSSSTAQVRVECPHNRHNGGCRRNVPWRGRAIGAAETISRRTIGGGSRTQQPTVSRCGRGPVGHAPDLPP